MESFKIGELFCGAGGLALGAKLASEGRLIHKWAIDYDKNACRTYEANIHAQTFCKDIRKVQWDSLENIDALTFGFPCNDFSIVGEQSGIDGHFGALYKHCVNAVDFFKPKWFLAENVSGLRNSNDGTAFKQILEEFANLGYNLYPHLYRFEEYGVPQKRHRIIFIGIRNDIKVVFQIPAPTFTDYVSASMALKGIPENAPNHERTQQSQTVIDRLSHINPGSNAFNSNLPDHLKLNVKGAKLSQIYKRLHPHQPSYTITASGGGGTHVYHFEEPRALTNRERARIQSFPDDFIFMGGKESVRKQIGMAVPPLGASVIFKALLQSFDRKHYPYVDSNIKMEFQNEFIHV